MSTTIVGAHIGLEIVQFPPAGVEEHYDTQSVK